MCNGIPFAEGTMLLDGVSVGGAPIRLDFLDPAGLMTGCLLPTDRALDAITIPASHPFYRPRTFLILCVDAANPFIFVSATELGLTGSEFFTELAEQTTATLMEIRSIAAVRWVLPPRLQPPQQSWDPQQSSSPDCQ